MLSLNKTDFLLPAQSVFQGNDAVL